MCSINAFAPKENRRERQTLHTLACDESIWTVHFEMAENHTKWLFVALRCATMNRFRSWLSRMSRYERGDKLKDLYPLRIDLVDEPRFHLPKGSLFVKIAKLINDSVNSRNIRTDGRPPDHAIRRTVRVESTSG
jgi:hypothetical protein